MCAFAQERLNVREFRDACPAETPKYSRIPCVRDWLVPLQVEVNMRSVFIFFKGRVAMLLDVQGFRCAAADNMCVSLFVIGHAFAQLHSATRGTPNALDRID